MNGRRWTGWLLSLLLMALAASSVAAQTPESLSAESGASGANEQQAQKQGKEEAAKTSAAVANHSVKVDIQGIEGDLLKNVEAYLTLYQKRKDPKLSQLWIKRLHKQAVKEIQQALQPFGYYNVKVEANLKQEGEGKWLATYVVTPGPQVKIRKVDIQWQGEGAEEPELVKAAKAFPLKKGDALIHKTYEDAKTALLEKADSLGYPQVEVKLGRILIDPERNLADITLHIDTGRKFHIEKIRLHQDVLDPAFVERYLVDVKPGDVYSQAKLLAIQKDLVEAGYFSLVDVNPRLNEAKDGRVPVDVTLNPAKRQLYSIGLGYDTDVGFNIIARWVHRRLNRRGHKADAALKLSIKESYLRGNYWIPIRDPRTTKLGFTVALETENTNTSERDTMDLEVGYYLLWNDWITKLFTQFKYERFVVGDEETENTTLFSLGGRAERTHFEKGVYPRRGWSLFADLRGSPGLLSSTAYARGWTHGRLFLPVGENGRFNLRGELGLAWVDDFAKYPNSLRFYAGGDNSVRGYGWKDLGPVDSSGETIGGKQVLTFSTEYDHKVADQWVVAAFVDGGNAFDDDLTKLYYGAGAGVRWLSSVGAVRLDLAWPFNKDDEDTQLSDVHVHFGFEVNL